MYKSTESFVIEVASSSIEINMYPFGELLRFRDLGERAGWIHNEKNPIISGELQPIELHGPDILILILVLVLDNPISGGFSRC
jgi:hypothetical protein